MFCPKCGGKIKDDNSFCPLCGEPLEAYKAAQAQGIVQPIPVVAEPVKNTDVAEAPAADTAAPAENADTAETKPEGAAAAEAPVTDNTTGSPVSPVPPVSPVDTADSTPSVSSVPKINYADDKKPPIWVLIVAGVSVLAFLIIGFVVTVSIVKKLDTEAPEEPVEVAGEEATPEAEEPEATEETVEEEDVTPAPTEEPEPASCDVTVYYGNEYGLLSDVLVEFKKDGQVVYSDTTVNGTLTAKDLEPGDYMIRYTGADLFGDEYKITLEPGDNKTETVLLARIEDPEAAYVFVTWEGSQDIDACMYNSSTGQYVKYDNPIDDMGNFIYQDNNAFRGYEILYVRDRNADYDHIIYVMDQASVQTGEPSEMEADGLRIRVYTIDGLIEDTSADKDKNAALFSPGSITEGDFEKNAVYVDGNLSKLAGYEWTQIEKDEPGEETEAKSED